MTSLLQSDHPERLPARINLTAGEQRQLEAAQKHLALIAKHDAFDTHGDGSVNGVIRKCEPAVREAIRISRELAENYEQTGGRRQLYDRRDDDMASRIDPISAKIASRAKTEDAIGSLHERMGTQQAQERIAAEPPSMRDHLTAAFDNNEGSDHD